MTPEEFVQEVVCSYEQGEGVFIDKVNAEDHLPSSASALSKALFLFYVIQLDYATRSQRLYANARSLVEENSRAFSPYYISSLDNEELRELLDKLSPRYINEATRRYKVTSLKLLEEYSGDPRIIFESYEQAVKVLDRVKEFRGFGPKIGNFFVRAMVNTFNYQYADIEEILLMFMMYVLPTFWVL